MGVDKSNNYSGVDYSQKNC